MYEQDSDRLDRCSHLEKVVFSPSSHFPFIAVLLATGATLQEIGKVIAEAG
ncbi:hypothetical protein [Nostoc sp. C057]|uniref:hypothetical protein n=1 Tax=Nostoc sp. C057 TaxID=2576903 RepID=UPI0015C2E24B|nr:hypothetical protein [Nostoc sp. C057]